MIASLRGKLLVKDATSAVIECGGVGYGLAMSLTSLSRLGQVGEEVSVLVSTVVSQDAIRLFGFCEAKERDVFEILTATSGVGPKLALSILSVMPPDEVATVIDQEDKTRLVQIPGVGNKKAARLLVELKGRMPVPVMEPHSRPLRTVLSDDLTSALVNLGFKPGVGEEVARRAMEHLPEEGDVAVLLKEALRLTQPRR